jgi:hypothetical protein
MPIPNLATFIYIGDMPFSYVHSLAVRSAAAVNHFSGIRMLCDRPPTGLWWETCAGLVDIEIITPPATIFGIPLLHPSHVTDAVRLHEMRSTGGIFLDLDVLSVKPLARYRDGSCVLAKQHADGIKRGLGCAVMMCEPGSAFVTAWLEGYDPTRSQWFGFRSRGRDEHWSEMSTRYPAMLADRLPDAVTVLEHETFYPYSWEPDGLRQLFVDCLDLADETACLHLWEANSWDRHLAHLNPGQVARGSTTFTKAAHNVLVS